MTVEVALLNHPLAAFPRISPARATRAEWQGSTIFLIFLLLGVSIRLASLFTDRCLWIDEAMLALNVLERSPARLFEPLDRNQGAPVGFLLAVKAATELFGTADWALRVVPLFGSILGFFAFSFLAIRILPPGAARVAVALFAISPALVSYSTEAKQYATDAAISIGMLAMTLPPRGTTSGTQRRVALALAGALAVWCSHPILFVLASIGTVWFIRGIWNQVHGKQSAGTLLADGAVVAVWLASFVLAYFLTLRHLGGNSYLKDYWSADFMPLPPRSLADVLWVPSHTLDFLRQPGGFEGQAAIAYAILACLAVVLMLRDRTSRMSLFLLILPGVFALLASGLHKYPFGGRLLLFLVPAAILLVARGAAALAGFLGLTSPLLSTLALLAVIAWPAWQTVEQLRSPKRVENLRAVLDDVRKDWQPGDRIYVYNGCGDAGAGPAFAYYGPHYHFPPESIILGGIHRDNPRGYGAEITELARTPGRVWLVFSHRHKTEEAEILGAADAVGVRESCTQHTGAAGYCYRVGD